MIMIYASHHDRIDLKKRTYHKHSLDIEVNQFIINEYPILSKVAVY